MKNILAFNGSARKNGNTHFLIDSFLKGVDISGGQSELIEAHNINIEYCTGCLRCNIIKRCSIRGDDWEDINAKIKAADVLVFASPIYFHHVSAQLKKIIDRFRSFVHVEITETGLKHTPHFQWEKDFVLLLSLGSSNDSDAIPVIDLFNFLVEVLGPKNRLHIIVANRLGVVKQVIKTKDELQQLYPKLGLSTTLVDADFQKNQGILKACEDLGKKLAD